jgi:hypothetical protein
VAWVRLHDGAMSNLKISELSDSAFRLWIRGLCYCQTALTDGLIPHSALRDMGAKRKDVDVLASVLVEGRAPLWERVAGFGFKVHDYLFWNDSRDVVQARQQRARDRLERWRSAKGETHLKRVSNGIHNALETPTITKPNLTKERTEEIDAAEAFLTLWHDRTTLEKCRGVTPKRRKHIQARLKEHPIETWGHVFDRIEASAFCHGQNDRGWKATFGWVIGSPDVAVKTLEGVYDDRRPTVPQRTMPSNYYDWECPHEPKCNHPTSCYQLVMLAEAKKAAS